MMENLQERVSRLDVSDVSGDMGEAEERQLVEAVREVEEASRRRKKLLMEAKEALFEMEQIKLEQEVVGRKMKRVLAEMEVNENVERNQRCVCVITIRGLTLVSLDMFEG